jgi:exocyst complex component 7
LEAVDQLRANVRFFSSKKSFKSSDGIINHANGLLAKAILKLEDEFKHLLTNYRFAILNLNLCFSFQ